MRLLNSKLSNHQIDAEGTVSVSSDLRKSRDELVRLLGEFQQDIGEIDPDDVIGHNNKVALINKFEKFEKEIEELYKFMKKVSG